MNLLVVGATGPTGQEIVKQALAEGHAVTALVRDAGRANFPAPVQKARGDVLDAASLEHALAGQDAVVSALGSGASGPFGEITLLSRGTQNLVAAMQAKGVRRLVCITGVGAGESQGHGPWYYNWLIQPLVLRGVYHDKTRQESVVKASGLDWTLVRPGMLTNGPAKGESAVQVWTDLAGKQAGSVSRADVAAFCLRELSAGQYQGKAPVLSY